MFHYSLSRMAPDYGARTPGDLSQHIVSDNISQRMIRIFPLQQQMFQVLLNSTQAAISKAQGYNCEEIVPNQFGYYPWDGLGPLIVLRIDENTLKNIITANETTIFQLSTIAMLLDSKTVNNGYLNYDKPSQAVISYSLFMMPFFCANTCTVGDYDSGIINIVANKIKMNGRHRTKLKITGSTEVNEIASIIYKDMVRNNPCPYLALGKLEKNMTTMSHRISIDITQQQTQDFTTPTLSNSFNNANILHFEFDISPYPQESPIVYIVPQADKEYNNKEEYKKALVNKIFTNPGYVLEHMIAKV